MAEPGGRNIKIKKGRAVVLPAGAVVHLSDRSNLRFVELTVWTPGKIEHTVEPIKDRRPKK